MHNKLNAYDMILLLFIYTGSCFNIHEFYSFYFSLLRGFRATRSVYFELDYSLRAPKNGSFRMHITRDIRTR